MQVILNAWDNQNRTKETNKPTVQLPTQMSRKQKTPYANTTPPRMRCSVSAINRLQCRIIISQEPDPKPNRTTITTSAMGQLVHSSPRLPSVHVSRRRTLGRLLPPLNSPSTCWFTSTFKVFPTASGSRRVGTARRHFCGIRSLHNSSTLRVRVSAIRVHAWV